MGYYTIIHGSVPECRPIMGNMTHFYAVVFTKFITVFCKLSTFWPKFCSNLWHGDLIHGNGITSLYIRVGTMATKFKSLLTDDKNEITKSDAEWFFWNRTTSNYFYHFKISTILYRFSQLSILKTSCLLIVGTVMHTTSHQVWTAVASKTWAWLWFSNE